MSDVESQRDRVEELRELVRAARRLAVEIDSPVYADLIDAQHVLDDELGESDG